MIFSETWQIVLDGRKTQTRRVASGDKPRWRVGASYAIQPGRGQKAVGRFVVLNVRREKLGAIRDGDVRAEGFADREEFIETWKRLHGEFDPELTVDVVEFELEEVTAKSSANQRSR